MQLNIADWSGSTWVTAFTNEMETVLGKTAKEFGEAAELNKDVATAMANDVTFKQYMFKNRVKVEHYNVSNL